MRSLFACLLSLLCGLAHASDEAERAQIKQERDAAEARYTQQEAACRKQFVVTSCLEKARADRHASLKLLRAREAELDDAVRRQRAQAHAQRMAEKEQAAESRNAPKEPKPPKEPRDPKPTTKTAKPPTAKASAPDRSVEEKRQREAFEARQREIQAHREEVEKRNAERAARKPPQPLPVPGSGALP